MGSSHPPTSGAAELVDKSKWDIDETRVLDFDGLCVRLPSDLTPNFVVIHGAGGGVVMNTRH